MRFGGFGFDRQFGFSRVGEAAVVASTFTPTDLGASLRAWWKADSLSLSNNDPLVSFTDSSGNGNHIASGISPTYKTNIINGKPAILFVAASTQFLRFPITILDSMTEGSVFFVAKSSSETPPSGGPILGDFGTDALGNCYPWTDGSVYEDFLTTVRKSCGDPGAMSSFYVASLRSKASDFRASFNGTDFFTTGTNTFGANTATDKYFGSSLGTAYYDGHVAEIVLCSSFLSDTDAGKVVTYLQAKYAL